MSEGSIFKDAIQSFLSSLPPRERDLFQRCASPKDLLASIESMAERKNEGRFRRCLGKIQGFSNRLEPYFPAIGILVQSHPEFAAIAWGALRLILQLASNYVTFFQKLADTLERLGQELPQYQVVEDIWKKYNIEPTDRFKSNLSSVYVDIFQFFRSIAGIFTKKDGRSKWGTLVVTDLFWKPFDMRFNDLLQKLKFHCQMVKDEIIVALFKNGVLSNESNEFHHVKEAEERLKASEARAVSKDTNEMAHHLKSMMEQQCKAA